MMELDIRIAAWRNSYRYRSAFSEEDLDELEGHLRDHVRMQMEQGIDLETAFLNAVGRLGDRHDMEREYGKTYWDRIRMRGRFRDEWARRGALIMGNLKLAARGMVHRSAATAINLTALAVGIATCLLIGLWVRDELSFDRFHSNADRIVRVEADWAGFPYATSALRMGPTLLEDFPEIESMTRLNQQGFLLQRNDIRYQENEVFFADSTFFEVFDFEMISGNPGTALTTPGSVVLTEGLARTYFGTADPLGGTLSADHRTTLTVTGVVADPPEESHLQFDALVSMSTAERLLPEGIWQDWFWTDSYTYLTLNEPTAAADLSLQLPAFEERHMGPDRRESGQTYALKLEPLTALYLHPDSALPIGPTGSMERVRIFSMVALLVLLLACINFTNLSTARASERSQEVGVRKTFGAARSQLAFQFLLETFLLALLALVIGYALTAVALPAFNSISGKHVATSVLFSGSVLPITCTSTVLVTVLAGIWPSVVLSRFRPADVLKGQPASGSGGSRLRRCLVVVQFTAAIALLASTLVIRYQLDFLKTRNPGFDRENLLVLEYESDRLVQQRVDLIREKLMALPGVLDATASSDTPGSNRFSARTEFENSSGEMEVGFAKLYFVDQDFLDTYGMKMLAGRNFSPDYPTDSVTAMVVNERAARSFGFDPPSNIVGKRFSQWGAEGEIIGVMEDFNFVSLHEPLRPLSLRIDAWEFNDLTLRLRPGDPGPTIAAIQALWQDLAPHRPFDWHFLDRSLDAQYTSEARFERLLGIFSILAAVIACLGLFGLASNTAVRRTREISIRKTLGATSASVVWLLSRDFTFLVLTALVLAVPIVWLQMSAWLDQYPYRIDLPWETILIAGAAALILAWISIGSHALRAARLRPMKGIRAE